MAKQENSDNSVELSAKVIASPSATQYNEKAGSEYSLMACEILSGPAKGSIVTGRRTTLNSKGVEKDNCEKGDKVTLHMTIFEKDNGERIPSFQISTAVQVSSNESLMAIFDTDSVEQAGEE